MAYNREKKKDYYIKNREEILMKRRLYREASKERIHQEQAEYRNTKEGRAKSILGAYNYSDRKYNRGEGDLTSEWIVENIFSKCCVHCGETDWHKLGCNRLDNSKPHTRDNVEPCCWECNDKLGREEQARNKSQTIYQYTLDGELVKVWESAHQAARELNLSQGNISTCCRGGYYHDGKWVNRNQYRGYRWSYKPL